MPKKKVVEVLEVQEEEVVNPNKAYLEGQLAELQALYAELQKQGVRSISDLEVKMSYLQRDISLLG